jgi:hypothetical protein
MERYELELRNAETHADDEQARLVAKAMVSVVVAMALLVMLTVVAFSSGGSIIA